MREMTKPDAAEAYIVGESEPGYLDGIPPKRIRTEYARLGQQTRAFSNARLDMRVRWTLAAWPNDYWAGKVYPKLSPREGKRRLARELMWFCRLTDEDGPGVTGWISHQREVARRSQKLTKLDLRRVELRGPGTELDVRLVPETVWAGGIERTQSGALTAANMPSEETYTSPHPTATEGTVRCTFPLLFQGRPIQ